FSVVLLALRIDSLESEGKIDSAVSREGMFLVNNLIFVLLTFTVLIGTVFPLIVEALRGKQMSVGRPYFDSMVVPVGTALLFLIGIGPALPWGRATGRQALRSLLPPLITGAVVVAIGAYAGARNPWTLLTLLFGGYAAHVTLVEMFAPIRQGGAKALRRGRRRFGSYIVHAGAIVVLVAIAVSSTMRTSTEVRLDRGQSAAIGPYTVTFLDVEQRMEPNRESTIAKFSVTENGKPVTTLEPRMNQYPAMREPIGTPAVHSTAARDLYLSIMNVDTGSRSISVMMLITPMVSWIWIAVLIMGLGGVVALIPVRSPAIREAKETLPVPGEAAEA
ncbi:MAG TPA: cytochrome c-type biogenesis CcmF C-terminal domain-containing protein, partial [Thermoanaerobaculia bacterium]|nr:cytochrome c-type biogenesis CcmF C-terminal domain-containing protein [Thermoanaerobaculia bacterium]